MNISQHSFVRFKTDTMSSGFPRSYFYGKDLGFIGRVFPFAPPNFPEQFYGYNLGSNNQISLTNSIPMIPVYVYFRTLGGSTHPILLF